MESPRRTALALALCAAIASGCGSPSSSSSAPSKHATTSSTASQTRTIATNASPGAPTDRGLDTHGTESGITYDRLPPATKAEVDRLMRAWAHKYPTAADATTAGWFKSTPSFYGIGSHYTHGIGFPATPTFDLMHPNMLLYDGEGPDAKFAGVSYAISSSRGAPIGFSGPYDVWHSHKSVCIKGGVVSLIDDNSSVWLSASECTARGGRLLPIPGDLMIHVWIGPGYFKKAPIFAHDNPKLFDGFLPQRDV